MNEIKTIDQKEINGVIDFISHCIIMQQWKPEVIVAIAKGGYIPSRLLAQKLGVNKILSYGISFYNNNNEKTSTPFVYQDLSNCKSILDGTKILIVDDIADTGESLINCMDHIHKDLKIQYENIRTCSLYIKPKSKIITNYYFNTVNDSVWCVFPWE